MNDFSNQSNLFPTRLHLSINKSVYSQFTHSIDRVDILMFEKLGPL